MDQIERPPRKEMSPRWFFGWTCVGVVLLGWAWWNRGEIPVDVLFGYTVVVAIPTGMALYGILRNY